eukprot:196803_1
MMPAMSYSSQYIVNGYIHMLRVVLPEEIECLITIYYGIDLAAQIHHYYAMLQQKRDTSIIAINIRSTVLSCDCPEDDLICELYQPDAIVTNSRSGAPIVISRIKTIRKNDDTVRGKLWRWALRIGTIDAATYCNLVERGASHGNYVKIRSDVQALYFHSIEYNSRVSEESVVRILNAYCHQYNATYIAGSNLIVGGLLYAMPEVDAFATFCVLMQQHLPTYIYMDTLTHSYGHKSQRCGAYAAAHLASEVIRVCDHDLFIHLEPLPVWVHVLPLVMSFQCFCQRSFTQIMKLWDFLFCFGVHLNPVIAAAQIISNKELMIHTTPTVLRQGLLSARKWMNGQLDAKAVIECAMKLILILRRKQNCKLWSQILHHASDLNVACELNQHWN